MGSTSSTSTTGCLLLLLDFLGSLLDELLLLDEILLDFEVEDFIGGDLDDLDADDFDADFDMKLNRVLL